MVDLKYITRFDYGKSRGHWVRIRLFFYDVNISKFFSDSVWGSQRASFKAAKKFRNEQLWELNTQKKGRIRKTFHSHPSKINQSDSKVCGVHAQYRRGRKIWVATYYPEKYCIVTKCFSVSVYGEQRAYKMAVAFRKAGEKIAKARMGMQ